MTQQSSHFGRDGERAAERFLKKKGYRILETNFRSSAGEIDIVGEREGVLTFVEVKSRADHERGHPAEALTPHKRKKIGQVAQQFLTRYKVQERDCRFDVVTILGDPGKPKEWQIELIQDAFRL